jgi:SNF2 family DNA or RNA helicase
MAKMAFGHSLQAADWHVRLSNTWSYVPHSQGEDRSRRMGREEEVHYIDLITAKTVDEEILEAIEAKRDYAAHLSRPTVGALAR